MIYLALIHGTRGFCFYNRRPVSTPLWESMLRAGKEVRALTPILFSAEPSGLSEQDPDGYASGIHCLPRTHGGKLYLVAVNAEYRDVRVHFRIPGLNRRSKISVLFEDREIEAKDGRLTGLFGPYERHVYEIVR